MKSLVEPKGRGLYIKTSPKGEREKGKNKRGLYTAKEVKDLFREEPLKLVAYVQGSLENGRAVCGIHLAQLAELAGICLRVGNSEYRKQDHDFYPVVRFDNIREVLAVARAKALAMSLH